MVPGSVGSPAGRLPSAAAVTSTAVVEVLPRDDQAGRDGASLPGVHAHGEGGHPTGAAQLGVVEDHERRLPAELEEHPLEVPAAWAITLRPVAVEPVKLTWSTRSSSTSRAPKAGSDEARMLTTPAGMSVSSAISRPSTVAHHGVSGAGLRMTVLPAASAGPSLARLI